MGIEKIDELTYFVSMPENKIDFQAQYHQIILELGDIIYRAIARGQELVESAKAVNQAAYAEKQKAVAEQKPEATKEIYSEYEHNTDPA